MFNDFLWGIEASEKAPVNNFKDCHFSDGTSMDSDQCNNYLRNIKNNLVQSFGLTPETDMEDVKTVKLLDRLLKTHQEYASHSMKRV